MKISISLYIFTHTKYIYLKSRKKFLSKYGPRKIKNKRFLIKNLFNTFMEVEVLTTKIIL